MIVEYKEDYINMNQLFIYKSIKTLTCFFVGLSIVFSCIGINAFAENQVIRRGENDGGSGDGRYAAGAKTTYTLTINNGSGGGSYAPGTSIIIKADTAPSGKKFNSWVVNSGSASIANGSSTTFLTMASNDTTITATYKNLQSTTSALTVNNSSGGGSYTSGSSTITKANTAPSGQELNSGNSSIAVVKKVKKTAPKTVKGYAESNKTEKVIARARPKADAERKKQERAKKRERLRYQVETSTPNGRNMKRKTASVVFRHSFLDRKTVITNRTRTITRSDGTATEPESTTITTGVGQEDSYSTKLNNDIVRLRWGLTDTIEVFADAGLAYDLLSNISDMEPVFGGGGRVNIAVFENGFLSGLYLAISGEYLQGKLIKDDSSVDWQDMTATLESGIVFSKMSFFAGCSYMIYSESITTKQIQSLPDLTIFEDELEQQGSINLSGGIEYNYSPSMHFLLEIQAPNRQGGIISVEYRF